MSLETAVNSVKKESAAILSSIKQDFAALNLDTDAVLAIRDKYNLISREVLGLSYEALAHLRELPPIAPSSDYDQKRLGLLRLMLLGQIVLPGGTSGNLRRLQEAYKAMNEDLVLLNARMAEHPPTPPTGDVFDIAVNIFKVRVVAAMTADGIFKSRDEVASELGKNTFEVFMFSTVPQLYFIVYTEFIGLNSELPAVSTASGVPQEHLATTVVWYGSVNANSANTAKMHTSLGLTNPQIRSATFGDDMALSSSSLLLGLLEEMETSFNYIYSNATPADKLITSLESVLHSANAFLAQMAFRTTLIDDSAVIESAFTSGVSENALASALVSRDDNAFNSADFEANTLFTSVVPAASNSQAVLMLGDALQQVPDTPRYTNLALNEAIDLRAGVLSASKRVVASIAANTLVVQRQGVSPQETEEALNSVRGDIAALRKSYDVFLNPPPVEEGSRYTGTATTESANLLLLRSANLLDSLRIDDQLREFPVGFDFSINDDIAAVLAALSSCALALRTYFDLYKDSGLRAFVDPVVSVSSTTNFILAKGEPLSSTITKEYPQSIENLRQSIKDNILETQDSEELYRSVSIQIDGFVAALRGDIEDSPVTRLFKLPVNVIDAVLPSDTKLNSFSLTFEGDQEGALRQLRRSFDILGLSVAATLRDLETYSTNFDSGFTDAKRFNARLAGDSISDLVVALRQA